MNRGWGPSSRFSSFITNKREETTNAKQKIVTDANTNRHDKVEVPMTSVFPHLPELTKMDSELETIMRRKRAEVDGDHEPEKSGVIQDQVEDDTVASSSKLPKRADHRRLSDFSDTGDPRIDGLRGRIKTYFTKIAKHHDTSHDEVKEHFRELAEGHVTGQDQSQTALVPTPPLSDENVADGTQNDDHENEMTQKGDLVQGSDLDSCEITIKGHDIFMVDPYGDSGKYTGQMVNDKPHGLGTMEYTSGKHYEGEWKEGKWHGMGVAKFACGDHFEGHYVMDKRNGTGHYTWADGREYEGTFYMDERHGWGILRWSDGSEYQGEFLQGQRNGVGAYKFAGGSVYVGDWKAGKFHGFGEMKWKDGRSYTGEWQDGHADGKGVGKRADDSVVHDGLWRNDMPQR